MCIGSFRFKKEVYLLNVEGSMIELFWCQNIKKLARNEIMIKCLVSEASGLLFFKLVFVTSLYAVKKRVAIFGKDVVDFWQWSFKNKMPSIFIEFNILLKQCDAVGIAYFDIIDIVFLETLNSWDRS